MTTQTIENIKKFTLLPLLAGILLTTGCANFSLPDNHSSKELSVNPTELSQYWVIKDQLLDWSKMFDTYSITGSFTATFTINSEGKISDIAYNGLTSHPEHDYSYESDFSHLQFMAAKDNYNRVPVTVTALVTN